MTTNHHEHIAREEKARRLAEMIIAEQEDVLLLEGVYGCSLMEALDFFDWDVAAGIAGVNPPSETTIEIVKVKVQQHFARPAPADPFEGINGR